MVVSEDMKRKFSIAVIVVAAGMGRRAGGLAKAMLKLQGVTLLQKAITVALSLPQTTQVIVACVPGKVEEFMAVAGELGDGVVFVEGGAERHDSVEAAFRAIKGDADVVLVHDIARPFASAALFDRVAYAAWRFGAAVPVVSVADTVKQVRGGEVVTTVDRSALGLVQTPQGFRRELYSYALDEWVLGGRPAVTDDSMLVERLGVSVASVDGEGSNSKITDKEDIARHGMTALDSKAWAGFRVGSGYDLHRVVTGRAMIIGGVGFDCGFGLQGHSDADVLAHAVCDAVLGAAGIGDIGRMFPDTDPKFSGADSIELLKIAVARAAEAGFAVVNVDCTVICERPKIAPRALEMASRLAMALGVQPCMVNVKGKTNEGLGPEGRGEAISAHAVALLSYPTGK
ncbi:MAG: 2-C-methyl-D-erythritol 2,4-cyclodiphosphate synthase [Myxococcota bacterium]|jgi:2-C-methyl-D-erythritol 4-phosphate cytidylyltransferase/2-C-methyl-D-erythritol 2,4-cyclodiphosphate synthase